MTLYAPQIKIRAARTRFAIFSCGTKHTLARVLVDAIDTRGTIATRRRRALVDILNQATNAFKHHSDKSYVQARKYLGCEMCTDGWYDNMLEQLDTERIYLFLLFWQLIPE